MAQRSEHAHGHDAPRTRTAALRAWLRHRLVPHRHDSAEKFDDALESSRQGLRALAGSFAVLMLTALVQVAVVAVTGSVALLGDTVHNFTDALTALPVGIAFLLGRRPASRRHTYGLGRAEDLAGVVVVLFIAASAVLVGYESLRRLVDPEPVTHLWAVAAAGLVGFVGNETVARWRIAVGRRIGSAALVADGLHARADGFTSLAVLLGALGVALGLPLADPLIGLLITVAILFVLRGAAREVFHRLMDAVEPDGVDLAERTAAEVPGVIRVDEVRMRWIGHALRAEVAITVATELTVGQAHRIAHEVEHALRRVLPRLAAATVHTQPAVGAQEAHELSARPR